MENKSNSKNSILPLILAGVLFVLRLSACYLYPSYDVLYNYIPFALRIMLILSLFFVCKQKPLSIITSIIALLLFVAELISMGFFRRFTIRFAIRFTIGQLHELYIVLLIVLLLVYAIRPSETKKKLFPILAFGVLLSCLLFSCSYSTLGFWEYWQQAWYGNWLNSSCCYTLFAFALSQTQSMALTEVLTKTHAINAPKTLSSLETLEKLAGLKQQGILSNEDYEKKKQEILRQF